MLIQGYRQGQGPVDGGSQGACSHPGRGRRADSPSCGALMLQRVRVRAGHVGRGRPQQPVRRTVMRICLRGQGHACQHRLALGPGVPQAVCRRRGIAAVCAAVHPPARGRRGLLRAGGLGLRRVPHARLGWLGLADDVGPEAALLGPGLRASLPEGLCHWRPEGQGILLPAGIADMCAARGSICRRAGGAEKWACSRCLPIGAVPPFPGHWEAWLAPSPRHCVIVCGLLHMRPSRRRKAGRLATSAGSWRAVLC